MTKLWSLWSKFYLSFINIVELDMTVGNEFACKVCLECLFYGEYFKDVSGEL